MKPLMCVNRKIEGVGGVLGEILYRDVFIDGRKVVTWGDSLSGGRYTPYAPKGLGSPQGFGGKLAFKKTQTALNAPSFLTYNLSPPLLRACACARIYFGAFGSPQTPPQTMCLTRHTAH